MLLILERSRALIGYIGEKIVTTEQAVSSIVIVWLGIRKPLLYSERRHVMTPQTEDFTKSSQQRSLYLAHLHHPFPGWVSASPVPSAADFTKKAAAAFADPQRRLLPICDNVSTFHSAIDYFANSDKYDEAVSERIKSACHFFEIGADVAPYALLFADEAVKSAAASEIVRGPSRFAVDTTIGGLTYQLLPLNDADDVRNSAADLAKMASDNRIHFMMLRPAAEEIVKAAQEFSVTTEELPNIVSRLGLERLPDFDKAATLLIGRENLCMNGSLREGLRLEYSTAVSDAASGAITADQCWEKIAAADDCADLRYSYHTASRLLLPTDIVFGGHLRGEVEKAARENVSVLDVLIPLNEFQKIDRNRANFTLSKSAAETLLRCIDEPDATGISLAVMGWEESDQRTLLRLAANA